MKQILVCDNCKKEQQFFGSSGGLLLKGTFLTKNAGLLIPKIDFEFCSIKCLINYLKDCNERIVC